MSNPKHHVDGGLDVQEATPKLKKPSMYKVVLLNDDYTPMDFVIDVLTIFFHKNEEEATQIMLKIHTEGRAICGVYSKDIAETKTIQVNDFSREHNHPLLCVLEAE